MFQLWTRLIYSGWNEGTGNYITKSTLLGGWRCRSYSSPSVAGKLAVCLLLEAAVGRTSSSASCTPRHVDCRRSEMRQYNQLKHGTVLFIYAFITIIHLIICTDLIILNYVFLCLFLLIMLVIICTNVKIILRMRVHSLMILF